MSSVADVFRRAAVKYRAALDAHFESLITAEDVRNFQEAARVIIALDEETKRLTKNKRAALKSRKIRTREQEADVMAALSQSLMRLRSTPPPAKSNLDPIETAGYVLRILLVDLVNKGSRGFKDRETLLAATAAVSKLGAQAKHSDSQKWGRMSSRPPSKNAKPPSVIAKLRAEAQVLLKKVGHLSRTDRARILNTRLGNEWITPRALIECARRNNIEV
jgi:hypothetical protein